MREGSGRGLGQVGSDFRRVGQGPRKVTRRQLCREQLWTPMESLQRSQRHILILYSWIWLGLKCGMCSFSANSSIRHWGKIKMFAWKVELNTPDCTVSSMNFQNFLGRGSPSPLQDPSPTQFRASLSIRASTSNRFVPSVWASPSIHSPYVWSFPQTREITNKIFHPSTSTPWLRHCVL